MSSLRPVLVAISLSIFAATFPTLIEAQTCRPSVALQITTLEAVDQKPTVLQVTITADRSQRPTNFLSRVRFTSMPNARVEAGGQLVAAGAIIPFFPAQESWVFVVRRVNAGSFMANFVVSDSCGDMTKFVGHGGANAAAGTIPPPPPSDPNPPQCPQALHDSHIVRAPNGQLFPTWHPPVDPATGCYFGHEHGADPRSSLANAAMPPFGYATAIAGLPVEPHEGFKVFLVHAGTRYEQKTISADVRLVFHMGTSRIGRYTNRFHSMIYDYVARDGSGRYAHVTGMADTGEPVGSTCDRPRRGGRDFSSVGCPDTYEIWNFGFQVIHPDDPYTANDQTRFTGDGAVAVFDPVTTRDPADLSRLIYTEQFRNGPAALQPLSPLSTFRGCRREAYTHGYWNNENRPTVYWTDAYGRVNPSGEAPGLIQQIVSATPKSDVDLFKYRRDFCDATVRAPN